MTLPSGKATKGPCGAPLTSRRTGPGLLWKPLALATILAVFPLPAIGHATTPCPPATVQFLADDRLSPALTGLIKGAKQDIWIGVFSFKAGEHPRSATDLLIRDLIQAHERGVSVQVVMELPEDARSDLARDNQRSAERLRKGGVTVYWDRPDRRSHMKVTVVDGRHLVVGSHNFTNSAFRHNHELSLLVDSRCLAQEATRYLQGIVREAGGRPR